MRSSVESLREEALRLSAHPELNGRSDLPPELRERSAELRTAVIAATIAEHEFLSSLLARPLSEQDRDHLAAVLADEDVQLGNAAKADPQDLAYVSDFELHARFQQWLEACGDSIPEMMVVELDWAIDEAEARQEHGDLWALDQFGQVTAEEQGLGVLTLADHGPAGGWPVLMFWGPRDRVVELLDGHDADPDLDYSPGTPACRACGWSQVGSVFTSACPHCGTGFDWD